MNTNRSPSRVVVAGDGIKAGSLASLIGLNSRRVVILSPTAPLAGSAPPKARYIQCDPSTARLAELGLDLRIHDFVLIAEDRPGPLRRTVENFRAQVEPESLFVITADPTLERELPDLHVRSESSIYRAELRDMFRRARVRRKLAEIREIARDAEGVLVLLWGNPDPDSMASALGLRALLRGHAERVEIAFTGELSRPENIAMARVLGIEMAPYRPGSVGPGTAVMTVDAQPAFFTLDPPVRFDVVIDHHPRKAETAARVVDVRPGYGATSTILTEYLVASGVRIPRPLATALFYGLKTDTNNLTRNVSEADIRAFQRLRALADADAIRSIELEQLPVDVLDVLAQAIARRRLIDDCLVAYMGELSSPDYGVYIADLFIRTWGVAVAVVALRHDDKLVAIFRSDGRKYDIGRIVEAAFSAHGTAGGHRTMARAEIELGRAATEAGSRRDWALETWFLRRLTEALAL